MRQHRRAGTNRWMGAVMAFFVLSVLMYVARLQASLTSHRAMPTEARHEAHDVHDVHGVRQSDSTSSSSSSSSSSSVDADGMLHLANSRIVCTTGPDAPILPGKVYGVSIVNRTCHYENLLVFRRRWYYIDLPEDGSGGGGSGGACPDLPAVSLASKPILIGKQSFKKVYPAAHAEIMFGYKWRPKRVCSTAALQEVFSKDGTPIPVKAARLHEGLTVMYSPEVAPWNYAHTLLNDLFPLFWGMSELGQVSHSARILVYGALYDQPFQPDRKKWLPQNNAFPSFSSKPAQYDHAFMDACSEAEKLGEVCVVSRLLAGSGAKTWSFVTEDYASPGTTEMWAAFRQHILAVLGVEDRLRDSEKKADATRPYKLVICDKKSDNVDNKRGIMNTHDVVEWAEALTNRRVEARAVVLTKMTIKEQTALLTQTDIYICNEGTMGTAYFLLPPGSVWLSVMNIFRRDETYDLYRPHSKTHLFWNTGGNIDWFAPTIRWVQALYYDRYLMEDVKKDNSHSNYRNYLPNWSVRLVKHRFAKLLDKAVAFLDSGRRTSETDNHSVMGGICSQLIKKSRAQALFTSIKCAYGMSWLCEFLVNGHGKYRNSHPKWKRGCGKFPTPQQLNISDPRDLWLAEEGIKEEPRGFNCNPSPQNKYPCPTSEPH